MAEQQEATLSIYYSVRLRRTKRRRVVVELVRYDYSKQLAFYDGGQLKFASKKVRHFFDPEDERKLLSKCKLKEAIASASQQFAEPERIGSIELQLFLKKGPHIEVKYVGGELFGNWTPVLGLRLAADAHPVLTGDKNHIAHVCAELPQGGGGIFQRELEEPTL